MKYVSIKNILFSLLAGILVLIFCYFVCEVFIYALFHRKLALFPRYVTGGHYGDFYIRRNIPNARYQHTSYDGKWQFRINAEGFRSEVDYPYAKKKGLARILVLGDSFTLGFEVHQEETYTAVLEKKLRDQGMSVEAINAGVSGFSNAEELIFFEQEGLRYEPDVVILGFFVNDLTDNVRADLYRLENGRLVLHRKSYLPAIRQRDFLNSIGLYRWLSEHSYFHNYLNNAATVYFKKRLAEENLERVIQVDLNRAGSLYDGKQYQEKLAYEIIKQIYEIALSRGIYFILLDIPYLPDMAKEEYVPSFPESRTPSSICDSFVNAAGVLKQYRGTEKLYQPHGQRHWTKISHRIVGEHLAQIVASILSIKQEGERDSERKV